MEKFNNSAEVMGIINVTPDSFYAQSRVSSIDQALKKAETIKNSGATWLDIGGESTRPGAIPVTPEEDLNRVLPIITAIKKNIDIKISIDTKHALVMQHAIQAGVDLINDTHALSEPNTMDIIANSNIKFAIMHMQGKPCNMQDNPTYDNIMKTINSFFAKKIKQCNNLGIDKNRIIVDPGFGFGKTYSHNWQIMQNIYKLQQHGCPILIGISRKSFIGQAIEASNPDQRGMASTIAATLAILNGANIIRTHDPLWTMQAIHVINCYKTTEKTL